MTTTNKDIIEQAYASFGTGDIPAEILLEYFKAGLRRNQADMHVGAGGLRRRLRKI